MYFLAFPIRFDRMAECKRPPPHLHPLPLPLSPPLPLPLCVVSALVDALEPSMVVSAFQCASYTSPQDFLQSMATKMGKFLKGGVPNELSAARQLLRQWNTGKVRYYVYPPEVKEGEGVGGEGLGRMFEEGNRKVVEGLRRKEEEESERHYIVLDDSLFAVEEEEGEEGEEGEEEMEGGEDGVADEEMKEEDEEVKEGEDEDRKGEEEVEDEVFFNPSPPRRGRPSSVNTTRAPPALTPSKAQQRAQEKKEKKRRKEEEVVSVAMEEEEQVSEPDSPAKHTRSKAKLTGTAPPPTLPARRGRGKNAAVEEAKSDGESAAATIQSGRQTRSRAKKSIPQ